MIRLIRLFFAVTLALLAIQPWGSVVILQDSSHRYDWNSVTEDAQNYDYGVIQKSSGDGARLAIGALSDNVQEETSFAFIDGFDVTKGGRSAGAMARREYQAASYHGKVGNAVKSRAPTNGQDALDMSVQVKGTSPRRVGIDCKTGELAVFDQTSSGVFHGHVRVWKDLTSQMQNALRKAGMVDRKGNILGGGQ